MPRSNTTAAIIPRAAGIASLASISMASLEVTAILMSSCKTRSLDGVVGRMQLVPSLRSLDGISTAPCQSLTLHDPGFALVTCECCPIDVRSMLSY